MELCATGIREPRASWVIVRKDGKHVHISMSAALLKDKDGVPTL